MKAQSPQSAHLFVRFAVNLIFFSILCLLLCVASGSVKAQSCENIPEGSGESISANVTVSGSGGTLSDQAVVPGYTNIDINAMATAFGQCVGMAWSCQQSPCVCQQTGFTYERTVNHIGVYVDISTSGGLNGTYFVGNVYGKNPNGTTAFFHVLDTSAANSTGPLHFLLSYPGTYQFRIKSIINTTPCDIEPGETEEITITMYVGDRRNNGAGPCYEEAGKPVNVTTGNMYVQQTDYRRPGLGDPLEITRTYNSSNQTSGLFGVGWSSTLDESVTAYGTLLLRLTLADGRALYFARTSIGAPFNAVASDNFYGQIVQNVDNSYTLTLKDGRVHQFNANGKLTSFADRNGNTTTLTLNASGNPTTITDPAGRTVTLTYDSQSKIASISDSLGTIATYARLSFGRMSSVTYADGSKFQFTYVITGNNIYLTTVKDALNNVLESHTYDSQGRAMTSEIAGNGTERYTFTYVSATETHVTDALNRVRKYFFDGSKGKNVVTRVEGACACGSSQIQTWTYDNNLNVVSKTDALNRGTTYSYDANGNRLTQTDATGTITYTYNAFGDVLTMTDQMGGVWTNTYDAHGNVLSLTNPLNKTTTLTYDGNGEVLTVTNPRNYVTTFTYDTNGNATRITDALNNETNIAYDARGRVTTVTNALSQVRTYEYDLAGRLKKIIQPDTNFVLFTYDLAGRRTKTKNPRGFERTFAYDAAYRLTSETNADNKTISYTYDVMSNLTGFTDALNRTTNYTYDDFNRVTKITYPEATPGAGRLEENFAYDMVGNLTTKTDQAGRVTTFGYDSSNRLTSTIDPALKTTAYEYNARSHLTAIVDPLNQRFEFVLDALGRVLQETRGAATRSFVYDALGNKTQRTDFNALTTNYTFDALDRLTGIAYPNSTSTSYSYDALSRLSSATNSNGTVALTYDNRGRVSTVTDVYGQTIGYSYDASGNRTQLSIGGNSVATYQYDNLNRLTQLSDAASLAFTFAYDATDKLVTRTAPNGVVTTHQYDGLDRLTRLTHAKAGTPIADFLYQFSNVDNITQITDGAGAHSYTYDSRDRLVAATHPSQPNESYGYDDAGNLTTSPQGSSYTYAAFNRLLAANGAIYSYDGNGNLISKTDGSGSWTYSWDPDNRLLQSSLLGGITVNYSYDALGRRIRRNDSTGADVKFVYDGDDVLRDLNANLTTAADYLNGPGIDQKLRQTVSGVPLYFLQDHLGTTRGFTDATGAAGSSYAYDSYGNLAAGALATRYAFTGREFDGDTGLYHYRARWYDPKQGRFISEDPIGFAGQDVNLFRYVWNNPLRHSDPTGFDGWGNDFADWLDKKIEYAREFWRYDDQEWFANGVNDTIGDLAYGFADMFRVGSGLGHALYDCDENIYGRAAYVAMDIARAAALAETIGGPLASAARPRSRSCFVAGTKVLTPNGEKNIEDITVGDAVFSTADIQLGGLDQSVKRQEVISTFSRVVPEVFDIKVGGEVLTTTAEHPFWVVRQGWTAAGELRRGSALLTRNGTVVHVDSVTRRLGQFAVYNFEVQNANTYYVSRLGVLVHNQCRGGSPAVDGDPYSPREVSKRQSQTRRDLGMDNVDPDAPIPDQGPGENIGKHPADTRPGHGTGERNVGTGEEHSRRPKGGYGRPRN